MFRLLLQLLAILVILIIIRAVLRSLLTPPSRAPETRPPEPAASRGELRKDPVCGAYVSTTASLTRKVNGEVLHFCSEQCRDKYVN